jgi:hypothetical protein
MTLGTNTITYWNVHILLRKIKPVYIIYKPGEKSFIRKGPDYEMGKTRETVIHTDAVLIQPENLSYQKILSSF